MGRKIPLSLQHDKEDDDDVDRLRFRQGKNEWNHCRVNLHLSILCSVQEEARTNVGESATESWKHTVNRSGRR